MIADVSDQHDAAGMSVLAIGDSLQLAHQLGLSAAGITKADYPEFNILSLPMTDDSFDVVLSDQVLEHVAGDPFVAVRESVRVARPGGYIIHTTCFFNSIHYAPGDFWRFTPDGLRLLCKDIAEPVEVGGWGNLTLIPITGLGLRFRPVPASRWHPLHWAAVRNNPLWPVSTWLVARKPAFAAP
ncbi:methyltransferase domain-containing protein [Streptomyces sp. SCSIO 30461]|uniref:methyltransferase domain-containing protein n=1 Tax=Streptomyces sp. SCSIO 30461 TaxID=3118085 RepID=UPI0030CEC86E